MRAVVFSGAGGIKGRKECADLPACSDGEGAEGVGAGKEAFCWGTGGENDLVSLEHHMHVCNASTAPHDSRFAAVHTGKMSGAYKGFLAVNIEQEAVLRR